MAYMMYRNSKVGEALQKTLDDLIENQQMTSAQALKVLKRFDAVINKALAERVRNKMQFRAEALKTYRFCDNVWTFVFDKVEFREQSAELVTCDRVKFVACDSRLAKQ